jgi:hypothetical protein
MRGTVPCSKNSASSYSGPTVTHLSDFLARKKKPTGNKERQESKHAHKNQETNENTTKKHK